MLQVSSNIIAQVFTILGLITKNPRSRDAPSEFVAMSLVYAFLSSKEQVQYANVLQSVLTTGITFGNNYAHTRIMRDFEKVIINASVHVFPNVPYFDRFFTLLSVCLQTYIRKWSTTAIQRS